MIKNIKIALVNERLLKYYQRVGIRIVRATCSSMTARSVGLSVLGDARIADLVVRTGELLGQWLDTVERHEFQLESPPALKAMISGCANRPPPTKPQQPRPMLGFRFPLSGATSARFGQTT